MKQAKLLFLILTVLATTVLASCAPGQGQAAGGWSGTAFHDGIIYAGTQDGRVVAVNATTRDLVWSRPMITEAAGGLGCGPAVVAAAIYTTPVATDGLVYVGTYTAQGGRMYALGMTDGEIIWEYPRGGAYMGAVVGDPVTYDDTLYISSSDGRVYALAVSTFTRRWESERLADKLWTSPVVVGDTLYVTAFDGVIYALSAETGETLDRVFELEAGFATSPVVHGGIIYAGSFDGHLYAIDIDSGESVWRVPQGGAAGGWFWADPIYHEGIVYAGCLDGTLYALDPETGQQLWDFDAGSPIVAPPVVEDDHGLLLVASESGSIYFFDVDAAPGGESTPLKTVSVDAGIRSAFCAADGFVYVRGEDNVIYVVDMVTGWIAWEFRLRLEE